MKFVLAIDTCGSEGSVQLFELSTARVLAQAVLPGRETQEKLLPAVERVLAEVGSVPFELAALAVVSGPGSFTGVRIGLAAVKGLAEALNRPVVAVSRLTVLAEALPTDPSAKVYALLDAGRGDVYHSVKYYGSQHQVLHESMATLADALATVREGDSVAVLEPALLERIPGATVVSSANYQASFRALTQRAMESAEFADVVLLDANYLRKPDAELALNARIAAASSGSHAFGPQG